MGLDSLADIIGLALACGAADFGGPMTKAEIALANRSRPASRASARRVRAAIRDGADPLGAAFCELRTPLERRPLGAFYTSTAILEPMLDWAFAQNPTRVVDPGCGSGRFTIGAAFRNKALDLVAVDLDPAATLMTRAALASVGAKYARVLQGDYLTVRLPSHDGRTAFVGNPPYVRHHDLDAATKMRAGMLARTVGHSISGLAGLHALFYLATLAKHARAGDVGSFVTSAEWLDVGYGSVIRNMFTNGLGGRSLTVYDPASVPFDEAMTTAAITTFQVGNEPTNARIARIIDATTTIALETAGRDVTRAELARSPRWSPFFRDRVTTDIVGDTVGTRFRVSRGQVTGANGFFVMTRAQARSRGIERFCVPIVSSADEIFSAGGVLREHRDFKVGLEISRELDPARFPRLAAYLRAGEAEKVHEGYVASHRSPWWAVTFPKPPIVATYMARQAPLFAANPDRIGLINVAHGLHPRTPMDDATIARVVETLNANRASFVGRGRTYHGGLEKFEPGEMAALPLELPTCP